MQPKRTKKLQFRTKSDVRNYLQKLKRETGSMYSPLYNPTGKSPTVFLQERGLLPIPRPVAEFNRRWTLCGAPGLRQTRR